MGRNLRIALVDYGMGNLRSVLNAFQTLGATPVVTADPEAVRAADAAILPGVGAFGAGMTNLAAHGLAEALAECVLQRGRPFLGICLGMQLLADRSEEQGCHRGLGWIPGEVKRLAPAGGLRVPHMGWNDVRPERADGLFAGLPAGSDFYFVHSYAFAPAEVEAVSARCDYGGDFVVAVERDNIAAVQFHPEKSHRAGLRLLGNWLGRLAC